MQTFDPLKRKFHPKAILIIDLLWEQNRGRVNRWLRKIYQHLWEPKHTRRIWAKRICLLTRMISKALKNWSTLSITHSSLGRQTGSRWRAKQKLTICQTLQRNRIWIRIWINSNQNTMPMSRMMRMHLCFQDSFKPQNNLCVSLLKSWVNHLCRFRLLRTSFLTRLKRIEKTLTILNYQYQVPLPKGGPRHPVVNQSKRIIILWRIKPCNWRTQWSRSNHLILHKENSLVSRRFNHMHQPPSKKRSQRTKFPSSDPA